MGMYIKNRKKVQRRIALGLPSDIQDMSIMNTEDAMAYRIALTEMSRLDVHVRRLKTLVMGRSVEYDRKRIICYLNGYTGHVDVALCLDGGNTDGT